MKSLIFIVGILVASVAYAQPPQTKMDRMLKMSQIHKNMQSPVWHGPRAKYEVPPMMYKRPGPPPWAGKGMMRGPRGPHHPFQGQRPDFRRGGPKFEVPSYHRGYRGQGWQHRGRKPEVKWGGFEKQNHRGNHKSGYGKKSQVRKNHTKH